MPLLHILLSKIKQHHVSELGVTGWVAWVCVGGVPPLVLFLPNVRRVSGKYNFAVTVPGCVLYDIKQSNELNVTSVSK